MHPTYSFLVAGSFPFWTMDPRDSIPATLSSQLHLTTTSQPPPKPPPLPRFHSEHSHASAFEADDELSTSASRDSLSDDELLDSFTETMSPKPNRSTHAPTPVRYPGEDTRGECCRFLPCDQTLIGD